MENTTATKIAVIGMGFIGRYMRICYEKMTGGRLRGNVLLCKATAAGLEELRKEFDCDVTASGGAPEALRRLKPDIILLCPPPSEIPLVVKNMLARYCEDMRKTGGILPDIYTFGPRPKVDFYYDALGDDVNTVKILPNLYYTLGGLPSVYLDDNYLTFSDTHRWSSENRRRLDEFLVPLGNAYEISEKDSIPFLAMRTTTHCLNEMCFVIADTLAERGLLGDHKNAASVMRAAFRGEWADVVKELVPCSMTDLEPAAADFAAKSAVSFVYGLLDFSQNSRLPELTRNVVRTKRAEVQLVSVCMFSREEVNAITRGHATKGGVCEKACRFFEENCKDEMKAAFERHLDGKLDESWWPLWRQKARETAEAVARHGLTLSN
jgi:pyrroline-5-carboxylate reductase